MSQQSAPPSPLDLTRSLLDISVTERADFRSCRRRWWLTTIENLQPKASDNFAFDFGTGIHRALEAYYKARDKKERTRRRDAAFAFAKWAEEVKVKYPDNDTFEVILDHIELGHAMLTNYYEFDQTAKVQLGRPIAVEGTILPKSGIAASRPPDYPPEADVIVHPSGRLMCPIVDPGTLEPITFDGQPVYLTARIDLLGERKTPKLGLWVEDHKTATSPPNDRGIDFDDQVTGYCYVVWRWLGIIPRGVVMNYLIKETPKDPRVVQSRKKDEEFALSTAKDQLTTPRLYREALSEWGHVSPSGRITSDAHAECLAALFARGWDPFFRRQEVTRNEHELISFEHHLLREYNDMRWAHTQHDLLYPNRSKWHCPGCPVNRICQAIEDGSDADHIADTLFVQAPDRKA